MTHFDEWRTQWGTNQTAFTIESQASNYGDTVLVCDPADNDQHALSWDVPSPTTDAEVLALIRIPSIPAGDASSADHGRIYIGGAGDEANEDGYIAALSGRGVDIERLDGGNITALGNIGSTTENTWYWIRFRRDYQEHGQSRIRVRQWEDGTTEPSTWDYDQTDTSGEIPMSGFVGLGSSVDTKTEWDWFAVGTSGDSAPEPSGDTLSMPVASPASSGPELAVNSTLHMSTASPVSSGQIPVLTVPGQNFDESWGGFSYGAQTWGGTTAQVVTLGATSPSTLTPEPSVIPGATVTPSPATPGSVDADPSLSTVRSVSISETSAASSDPELTTTPGETTMAPPTPSAGSISQSPSVTIGSVEMTPTATTPTTTTPSFTTTSLVTTSFPAVSSESIAPETSVDPVTFVIAPSTATPSSSGPELTIVTADVAISLPVATLTSSEGGLIPEVEPSIVGITPATVSVLSNLPSVQIEPQTGVIRTTPVTSSTTVPTPGFDPGIVTASTPTASSSSEETGPSIDPGAAPVSVGTTSTVTSDHDPDVLLGVASISTAEAEPDSSAIDPSVTPGDAPIDLSTTVDSVAPELSTLVTLTMPVETDDGASVVPAVVNLNVIDAPRASSSTSSFEPGVTPETRVVPLGPVDVGGTGFTPALNATNTITVPISETESVVIAPEAGEIIGRVERLDIYDRDEVSSRVNVLDPY